MKKVVIGILFTIYLFLTLTITIFLMKYNNFNVTELRKVLIVPMNKTNLNYQRGSLLIIQKENIDNIKENDTVFYYTADEHKVVISKNKITKIDNVNEDEKVVTLANSKVYSKDYVIGKKMVKIPIIGYLMMLLTSKIGYLFIILLPMLCFFFVQIFLIFKRKKSYEEV